MTNEKYRSESDDSGDDHCAEHQRAKPRLTKTVIGRPLEVLVDERGVERAIRKLRRKVGNEGVARELKRRRSYAKPSDARRKKRRDAERRRRRAERRARRRR